MHIVNNHGYAVRDATSAGTQYPLQLAVAMAMTIPVAAVFFMFQEYIMCTSEGEGEE